MSLPLSCIVSALVVAIAPLNASWAEDSGASLGSCKTNVGTFELEQCLNQALQAADTSLNGTYGQTMRVLSPKDGQKLMRVERLWVQYRDASCAAEYDLYDGGTAGPPTELACREVETQARIAELKRAYGWRVEKFGK